MACAARRTPILRNVAVRSFSAQAQPRTAAGGSAVEVTALPNKLVVASTESASPISRISVLYRAGSRYENYDNLGASHILRVAANLSNKKSSGFAVTRNIQQIGGSLSVTTDREVVEYNIELARDKLDTGLKFLQDVSSGQQFKPWELAELVYHIKGDLGRVSAQVRAVDLLHRAAFRTELGNSIFCAKHHVGRLSPETLQHFVANNCGSSRAAIVGIGIDHQQLVGFAKSFQLDTSGGADSPSKYFGGHDLRVDKSGNWAHVAVGTQGGSLANQKEALAFAVLQHVAGSGVAAKWGSCNGAIGKVVKGALGESPFGFSTLNASYTDNGLFGFIISAERQNARKAIEAAVKGLKQGSVSSGDLARAKAQLKAETLFSLDSESCLVSNIGNQALLLGAVQSPIELAAAIDAVSSSDVNAAAKKVASGKWSIGAVGNLGNVPFASELN